MNHAPVMIITGSRKGIGRHLAKHYLQKNYVVIGCSRKPSDLVHDCYHHYCLDVADEHAVKQMFTEVRKRNNRVDCLINNAGIARMNHCLLTPVSAVQSIFATNFLGTFLFCREAAKIMQKRSFGRIVNFTTVAAALNLEGEAIYAASKAAVESLTRVLSRELASFQITVNALGPTPVKTDLIGGVPQQKLDDLIGRQAIKRFGEFRDLTNVIDFFLCKESDFVTGQVVYLGGV